LRGRQFGEPQVARAARSLSRTEAGQQLASVRLHRCKPVALDNLFFLYKLSVAEIFEAVLDQIDSQSINTALRFLVRSKNVWPLFQSFPL